MNLDYAKTTIIEKAEIYKISFEVAGKNFIYIGLDTKSNPNYFGSSLIIYHYKRIYGKEIFTKELLESLNNITYVNLCAIEQQYIKEYKKDQKNNNYYSVNYTGENKANLNTWQWFDF
tara:strand:- start:5 stop:358 length:354 start_codon:yes stop_codon:yes gene_type:complete